MNKLTVCTLSIWGLVGILASVNELTEGMEQSFLPSASHLIGYLPF